MKKILSILVLSMISTLSPNVQAETQGTLLIKHWLSICEKSESLCFLMFESSVSTANFTQSFINQSLKESGSNNEVYLYCPDAASKHKHRVVFDEFYNTIAENNSLHDLPFGAAVAHYLQKKFPLPCD